MVENLLPETGSRIVHTFLATTQEVYGSRNIRTHTQLPRLVFASVHFTDTYKKLEIGR